MDGEGSWQRMKLYTHNDRAALYRADKAAWLMAKPQHTVTRPLVHFGAGSHPLSYCTYGCCPSMNFGSP